MVGTGSLSRWNALRSIMKIRYGTGAAVLPPSITRIHMEFAKKHNDGHMGPRKFWRDMLPRLKYHNPAIPMIVNRKDTNEGTALLSVYIQNEVPTAATDASSTGEAPIRRIQPPSSGIDTSKAVAPAADERVIKIDMKNKRSEDIWEQFLAETKAQPIVLTPEETAQLREVQEFERNAELDRQRDAARRAAVRKEKEMLARARESSTA